MLTLSAPASKTSAASSALTHASAHGKRHKQLRGRALHRIEQRAASLVRRRNIQQHDLIRARRRMTMRQLGRIAGVDDVHKLNAFDHTAIADIQTGDDSFRQQSRAPGIPQDLQTDAADFSGWNCTPITLSRSTAAVKSPP